MSKNTLINSAVFGLVLAVVLILVYMGFDKVDFDDDLEPWQKTALSGFVAGAIGYVVFDQADLKNKLSSESDME